MDLNDRENQQNENLYNPENTDLSSSKSLSPEQLSSAESSTSSEQDSKETLGKGYTGKNDSGSQKLNKTKVALSVVSGHKKGFAAGGGVIATVIALIIAGSSLVTFELVHIEKVIVREEAKVEQKFEQKAASSLLQKIICVKKVAGCPRGTVPTNAEENNFPDQRQVAEDASQGETLTDEINKFDPTSPAIEQDLSRAGIDVETNTNGQFIGLKETNGSDITTSVDNNNVVSSELQTGLPEGQVGIEHVYEPDMVIQGGETFAGVPDTASDNVDKTIQDSVTNGATPGEIAAAGAEEGGTAAEGETAAEVAAQQSTAAGEAGALGDVLNKVQTDINNGVGETTAISDGVSVFEAGKNPLLISSIAQTACGLQKDVTTLSKNRVPTIMKLLMRHSSVLLSLADQEKTGHITSKEVSGVMKLLNGDPNATKGSEASKPFSQSAAWQNAIGGKGGVPIESTALPTANNGTKIVNDINSVVNAVPGVTMGCAVENSPFGFIANGIAGIGQFFADDATLGLSQVAIIAGNVTALVAIKTLLLPEVIKYFTPVGINGLENSVQWMNNADAGTNLSYNNYARRLGANPVDTNTADKLYSEATQTQSQVNSSQTWVNRTFAFSNPDSLLSRIVGKMPMGFSATLSSITHFFTGFFSSEPSKFINNLATIAAPKAYADTSTTNPGDMYGITQYSFKDGEVENYDPVSNEQYLFSKVSYGGNSIRRIDALGNPNTYTDNVSGDSNNGDLLHCYVDPFTMIEEADPGTGADQYCGSIGSFDYQNIPPTNLPNDQTVAQIYCAALQQGSNANCQNQIASQIHNDVGHFRQYLLDTSVMKNFTSLTTNQ